MCAETVVVIPKLEQLVFEISGCPEQRSVQKFTAHGPDEAFHERMGKGNIRDCFDFVDLEDPEIGLPLSKPKERIVIRTEVPRHRTLTGNGAMEHPAESNTVDRSGMRPKADDPACVLIHDDEDPVSPKDCRLAAKQIDTPETVLEVADEGQPGRGAAMWHGAVMYGQDAPNQVFINGDAKSQGNLLSDPRAAPEWIVIFCAGDGVDDVFCGSFWPGLAPALRRKQYAVLSVFEGSVEVQQGGRSQHNCRTNQACRPHEQRAKSSDETIECPKIRRSLMGSIQDQQLMLDENGFRDHGTDAAWAQKPGNRGEDMNEKHEEMAHRSIVARTANARNYAAN
jgi:hypothetical protein